MLLALLNIIIIFIYSYFSAILVVLACWSESNTGIRYRVNTVLVLSDDFLSFLLDFYCMSEFIRFSRTDVEIHAALLSCLSTFYLCMLQ